MLRLLTPIAFAVASSAQTIDDFECTFTVLGTDHSFGADGQYFNFDVATVSNILSPSGTTFTTHTVYDVFNSRTGQTVEIIIWNVANGGTGGDGHGRLTSGASGGDWQTGDVLAFVGIPVFCNACPFTVLGTDHAFGAAGMYFNFDVGLVSSILIPGGSASNPFTTNTYYNVYNERTGQVEYVVLWNVPNGGTTGDGHGRKENGATGGDWETGDVLVFQGIETYCDWESTALPSESPIADPTSSPTKRPTDAPSPAPSIDGCDFDLEEYLETCYCSGDSAFSEPMPAAKVVPQARPVEPATPVQPVQPVNVDVNAYTIDQVMMAVHMWGFILASLLGLNVCISMQSNCKKNEYKVVDMRSEGDF